MTTSVNQKKEKPPPKKRVITSSKKWDLQIAGLTTEYQLGLLDQCFVAETPVGLHVPFLEQLIHSKWYGYRTQDMDKNIFDATQFVSDRDIAELLSVSRLRCFYCLKPIQLFYEYVRESNQWTLERIDNAFGHNRGNVEIACLGCNIRRKTMYYERFIMTKQMTITKMNES